MTAATTPESTAPTALVELSDYLRMHTSRAPPPTALTMQKVLFFTISPCNELYSSEIRAPLAAMAPDSTAPSHRADEAVQ